MARIYGINGVLRGKQGNNVFSVQNGTQVVKAYQPVVANPRTTGQREQRAKFALAGKMSGATPSLALSGMIGSNIRAKRARFVANILRNSATSGTSAALVASIPFADVVYSEGSVGQWRDGISFTAAWAGTELGRDKITATFTAGQLLSGAPAGYNELRIVALYDAATSTLEEVQVKETQATTPLTFVFRESGRRDCFVVGYIVPFIRTTSRSNPVSSGLYGSESAASLNVNSSAIISGADFGRSLLFSVVALQGDAQHAVNPSSDDRSAGFETESNGDVVRSTAKKK